MSKSISRSEPVENGFRIVSNDLYEGLQNRLSQLDPELGLDYFSDKGKVYWAGKFEDQSQWEFGPQNVVYYETEITERELTDAEKEWCEDTFMYSGDSMPETVYSFEIPKPKVLKKAIKKDDLDEFEDLKTKIPDTDTRAGLVQSFQEDIALNNYRGNQLSFDGHPHNLDPEWHPDHSDDSKKQLRDKARMRSDSYKDSWEKVFDLSYFVMKQARYTATSIHEPKLSATDPSYQLVELGVIGEDDKSYCRYCASTLPKNELLHPRMKGYDDKTFRTCESCADRRRAFNEQAVAEALDKRAFRVGGQRRLHENFTRNPLDQ